MSCFIAGHESYNQNGGVGEEGRGKMPVVGWPNFEACAKPL